MPMPPPSSCRSPLTKGVSRVTCLTAEEACSINWRHQFVAETRTRKPRAHRPAKFIDAIRRIDATTVSALESKLASGDIAVVSHQLDLWSLPPNLLEDNEMGAAIRKSQGNAGKEAVALEFIVFYLARLNGADDYVPVKAMSRDGQLKTSAVMGSIISDGFSQLLSIWVECGSCSLDKVLRVFETSALRYFALLPKASEVRDWLRQLELRQSHKKSLTYTFYVFVRTDGYCKISQR